MKKLFTHKYAKIFAWATVATLSGVYILAALAAAVLQTRGLLLEAAAIAYFAINKLNRLSTRSG